jgi:hypothetical protein
MQNYKLNCFRSYGEPLAELPCQKFVIETDVGSSEERQRMGRQVVKVLQKKYFKNITVFGGVREEQRTSVYMAAPKPLIQPPKSVTYYKEGLELRIPLRYVGQVTLTPKKDRELILDIVYQAIRKRIRDRGYNRTGVTFPKYFGGTPTLILVGENKEPVNIYEGFRLTVDLCEDGSLLVYTDPSSTERIDLYTYCKLFRARGISEEWLKNWIFRGRPRRKARLPKGSGIIINIDFKTRAKDYLYDGKNKLGELWESRGYSIPNDDFVVYMDLNAKPYKPFSYPASVVFLNTQNLELSNEQRRLFTLSPRKRVEKTKRLAAELFDEPLRINKVLIRFKTENLVTTAELIREGKIKEVGIQEEPKLRFLNDKVGKLPKDIELKGPYSGEKSVRIIYVIPEASSALVKPLHHALRRSFSKLRLGELIHADTVFIEGKPTEGNYRKAGRTTAERLVSIECEEKMALIILPRYGAEKHQFIKGMCDSWQPISSRKAQFLRIQTARDAINGKQFILRNIVLQIYLKTEKHGEALWILDRPAGRVGNTLYGGYDVTREVKREYNEETKEIISERKEAAAEAAVCDSRGLVVMIQSLISPTGETLTPDTVSELFRSMIQRGEMSLSKFDEKPKRLVLFKDGKVFKKRDLPNVKAGYRKVQKEFQGLSFDLISVIKGGIRRIYSLDDKNVPRGTYIVFNDKVGIINASQLIHQKERVTASPKRLEVAFSSNGVNVKQIIEEFFDLTALDWASLYMPVSTAIPLKIVQNLGEYLRRDIYIPEHVDYIPL